MEPFLPERNLNLHRRGLVDDKIYEYEMASEHSWITFGKMDNSNLYIIYMIGTESEEQGKGYAKQLLDVFFRWVKKDNGIVKVDAYTAAGEIKIRHVINRLAINYGVKVIT